MKNLKYFLILLCFVILPMKAMAYDCNYQSEDQKYSVGYNLGDGILHIDKYEGKNVSENDPIYKYSVGNNITELKGSKCYKYVYIYRSYNSENTTESSKSYQYYASDDSKSSNFKKTTLLGSENETIKEAMDSLSSFDCKYVSVDGKSVAGYNLNDNKVKILRYNGEAVKNYSYVVSGGFDNCYANFKLKRRQTITSPEYPIYEYSGEFSDITLTGKDILYLNGSTEDLKQKEEEAKKQENEKDLTIKDVDICSPKDADGNPNGVLKAFQIIGYILLIAKLVVPLILIILGSVDFAKAVIASNEKPNKDVIMTLMRRFIAAFIIFFIPTVLNFVLSLVDGASDAVKGDDTSHGFTSCATCLLDPLGDCQARNLNGTE